MYKKDEDLNAKYEESHERADTDLNNNAIHHTLGYGPGQAAPGNIVQELLDRVAALESP